MGEGLSKIQGNILTLILTILMILFTIISVFQGNQISQQNEKLAIQSNIISQQNRDIASLPNSYVRLERYLRDQQEVDSKRREDQQHISQLLCNIKEDVSYLKLILEKMRNGKK